MGATHSNNNQDTLDWDKINTDSFSSNLPSLQTMNKDTKQLIEKLDLEDNINYDETESENSNIFAWLKDGDNKNLENISDLINSSTNKKNSLIIDNIVDSGTSPFISSEDYENLANEKTSESDNIPSFRYGQQGGGVNETSSTSIGSVTKLSRRETIDSDDSNLSYLSSSAHTEGGDGNIQNTREVISDSEIIYESESEPDTDLLESNDDDSESNVNVNVNDDDSEYESDSDSNSDSDSKSKSKSEIDETSISPMNNQIISESEINTSDINMISSD